jgi:hypothetical protein
MTMTTTHRIEAGRQARSALMLAPAGADGPLGRHPALAGRHVR